MTTLGLGLGKAPTGEVSASFRTGWLRHIWVSLGSAGGAAVVLGIFALLERQPSNGFQLLGLWGPWPVLGLVALAILGKFMSQMSETIQTTFRAVVSSMQQGTEAQAKSAEANVRTSEALSRVADQGARHAQEVERLTMYAVQEFPIVHERLDKQDAMLSRIHGLLVRGKDDEKNAS